MNAHPLTLLIRAIVAEVPVGSQRMGDQHLRPCLVFSAWDLFVSGMSQHFYSLLRFEGAVPRWSPRYMALALFNNLSVTESCSHCQTTKNLERSVTRNRRNKTTIPLSWISFEPATFGLRDFQCVSRSAKVIFFKVPRSHRFFTAYDQLYHEDAQNLPTQRCKVGHPSHVTSRQQLMQGRPRCS